MANPYRGPEILSKIDATRISDALNCEAYFYLRHIRGLVPEDVNLALTFGSAIHAALAEHYSGKGFKAVLQAFDQVWLEQAAGRSDPKRNPARALAILTAYLKRYKQEYFEVLAIEVPFMIPVKHLKFIGILDLLVRLGDSRRLAVFDHKTTSSLSPYYWLPYRTNADYQGPGYLTAVSKTIAEVETFVPSAILVDANKTAFERQYFTPPKELFERRLLHWHRRMIDNYYSDCWPPNGKYCNRWGRCDYVNICEVWPDVTKAQLIEGYAISYWDPTEVLYSPFKN